MKETDKIEKPRKFKQAKLALTRPAFEETPDITRQRDVELIFDVEEVMDASVGSHTNPCQFECDQPAHIWTYEEVLESVTHALVEVAKSGGVSRRHLQDYAMLENYCQLLLKTDGLKKSRIQASLKVAETFHSESEGKTLARRIRSLFLHYRENHSLPIERRGGKREGHSFLDDETIRVACLDWLNSAEKDSITPAKFCVAVNEELLPRLLAVPNKPLHISTIYSWLPRLGFSRVSEKKGVYVDGHERKDVIEYRTKVYIPVMKEMINLMINYDQVGGVLIPVQPTIPPGEKRHVMFFHDESCFHGNDHSSKAWLPRGCNKIPRKSRGRLIHVSDFIGPEGQLKRLDSEGKLVRQARKITYPGAGGDPWWNTVQLNEQLHTTLEIFEELHPGCTGVFVFDCSTAHESHGEGAINAWGMNLKPGGNKVAQNTTYFPPETIGPNASKRGMPQELWTEGEPGPGEAHFDDAGNRIKVKIPKGIAMILAERGIFPQGPDGKPLRAKCSPRCPDPLPEEPPKTCCQAAILQGHQDFREQKSLIATTIEARGHKCVFLPKFHCELNPIEMFWGFAKGRYRQVKKSSFAMAQEEAVKALDSCTQDTMRRFCNRTFRFLDAYDRGLSAKAAAWCVKKQKGHRSISEAVMKEFDAVVR